MAAAMALSLVACVPGGKQPAAKAAPVPPAPAPVAAAPAPPEPPLSTPQTRVELPEPQPLSAEALATMEPPGAPLPPPKPAPAKKAQRTGQTSSQAARPDPPPAPVAPVQPPEPERAPIQEMVPAGEQIRLKAEADDRKRQIHTLLSKVPRQKLNTQELGMVETIRSFVKLSDQAEHSGDMRKAYELAERGLVLAKELPVAK